LDKNRDMIVDEPSSLAIICRIILCRLFYGLAQNRLKLFRGCHPSKTAYQKHCTCDTRETAGFLWNRSKHWRTSQ
jgi:hypothetical protein